MLILICLNCGNRIDLAGIVKSRLVQCASCRKHTALVLYGDVLEVWSEIASHRGIQWHSPHGVMVEAAEAPANVRALLGQ